MERPVSGEPAAPGRKAVATKPPAEEPEAEAAEAPALHTPPRERDSEALAFPSWRSPHETPGQRSALRDPHERHDTLVRREKVASGFAHPGGRSLFVARDVAGKVTGVTGVVRVGFDRVGPRSDA